MTELEINGGCMVFHGYNNGEKEDSYDFFDNVMEGVKVNVVQEDTLDMTKYDEVHIREESYDDTYYGFNDEEELPDDYAFDVKVVHVLLPNGESYDMTELVDDHIDDTTFETSSGSSYVDYYCVTKEGKESIEYNEEDDEW